MKLLHSIHLVFRNHRSNMIRYKLLLFLIVSIRVLIRKLHFQWELCWFRWLLSIAFVGGSAKLGLGYLIFIFSEVFFVMKIQIIWNETNILRRWDFQMEIISTKWFKMKKKTIPIVNNCWCSSSAWKWTFLRINELQYLLELSISMLSIKFKYSQWLWWFLMS